MLLAEDVRLDLGAVLLEGRLVVPYEAAGVVVFAHGSGSGRHSPRNRHVADALHRRGLGTVLMDLLTGDEERHDALTRELRFDVALLAGRLAGVVDLLAAREETADRPVGLFGASTGAAAAVVAAAERPARVGAVVSRGGRVDLAADAFDRLRAPLLLVVGGDDRTVLDLNRSAMRDVPGVVDLSVVPGATHLFEEPGTLDEVARLAGDWFTRHLGAAPATPPVS
ncbi:MAG: alpha/beta fold hydrolase [Streptosporangiales bacterium]|nr:alpha/beta fold hydrolase [Streptosporangiales bacterium]